MKVLCYGFGGVLILAGIIQVVAYLLGERKGLLQKLMLLAGIMSAVAGVWMLFTRPDGVRKLAVAVMERCAGRCAVFSGDDEAGYKYAVGEVGGDLRALVKQMNAALSGRGGGKPFFAQGSVGAKRAAIEAFFAAL